MKQHASKTTSALFIVCILLVAAVPTAGCVSLFGAEDPFVEGSLEDISDLTHPDSTEDTGTGSSSGSDADTGSGEVGVDTEDDAPDATEGCPLTLGAGRSFMISVQTVRCVVMRQ